MSGVVLYAVAGLAILVLGYLFWRTARLMQPAMHLRAGAAPLASGSAASADSSTPFHAAPPYRLVQARHGLMLVNPNDTFVGSAILRYGEYGELEAQFLLSLLSLRPGAVVEVGANIGSHTVPLAKALGLDQRELIAFEPQPFIFQNLCANLALNGIENVRAWPQACAAQSATLYFPAQDYRTAGNFGGVAMAGQPGNAGIAVPAVALDQALDGMTVGLMKIDVEGFELLALQGAQETIRRSRPVLYVENDRVEKSQALIEWLWRQEYKLWWHIPPLFNPDNFFGVAENIYAAAASFNMLCLPRELDIAVSGLMEVASSTAHPLVK